MSAAPAVMLPSVEPLQVGLDVLTPWLSTSDPAQAIVAAKCIGLLYGYHHRWANAPYLIEDVQRMVESDLWNPSTGAKSRTFRTAGKIDLHVRDMETGARVIFDHKTTSSDITDPNAPYWRQLVIEGQVNHYFLIEWENQRKVDYAVWDVVRKPMISPRLLSKADLGTLTSTSKYFGYDLFPGDVEQAAETHRETPLMYSLRLAHDCTQERPEWYFQRRQVARLDSEVYEYALELWGHAQDLIYSRRIGRHPRNSGACMLYGSPCKFLGICSGYDTPTSDKWRQKSLVHIELPQLQGDGRDVLTNSRIRNFQTCRQKHHFEYELGIERVDEEEKEALFFGSLFDFALEQFFLALKQQQQKGATL